MQTHVRRIHKHGGSLAIAIPPYFIKVLDLRHGDHLVIDIHEGGQLLVSKFPAPHINPERMRQPA